MRVRIFLTVIPAALLVSGCELLFVDKVDKTVDRYIDSKHLSELKAGVWIDPNGCDHWIIDDGIEGYLSQRLDREGKPVCSGPALANTAIGGFKSGSPISDPI